MHESSITGTPLSSAVSRENRRKASIRDSAEPFSLSSESPEDREQRAKAHRDQMRDANQRKRDAMKKKGISATSFFASADHLALLETVKKALGLRNRSQALAAVLKAVEQDKDFIARIINMDG